MLSSLPPDVPLFTTSSASLVRNAFKRLAADPESQTELSKIKKM
jgi:hypothetical protein